MTKDIKFLKNCMTKEKVSLITTKNPRLQKIIQKRIALYEEQIKVLEKIEKEETKKVDVLDYLFKGIKKYIMTHYCGEKTFIPRLEKHERINVQEKFLKNLLTNKLPKNSTIEIEFFYNYYSDSAIEIDLSILENNTVFFKYSFSDISTEKLQKIIMLYGEKGYKSLEEQIQQMKRESKDIIKDHSTIIKKRKKLLNVLKEVETMLKPETESKGGD